MMNARITYHFLFFIMISLFFSCRSEKKEKYTEHTLQQEQEIYTCPMHPEIIRKAPGSCPICGMDLVRKEKGNKSIEDIELEALLKPTNEFVVSTLPVIAMQKREEYMDLKVVGRVAYDTRQTGAISSRVKGRIEKLYVRYKYQPIKKGQRIMDIYSPELVTAQQNFIFLLQNDADNTSLLSAARDRLRLMGMTSNQVEQIARSRIPIYSVPVFSNYSGFITNISSTGTIGPATDNMQQEASIKQELSIREGMYVQSGQVVFSIYNSATALVLLDLFPDQQALVNTGHAVSIEPETAPHQGFRGKIDFLEPVFKQGAKTLSARVYFNNAAMQLPIGSRVTATIFTSSKNASWLPKEAVLSLGRDMIVFLKEPNGFRAHKILTGMQVNKYIQVLSGLSILDSVASSAHFLVDNEAFIKLENK